MVAEKEAGTESCCSVNKQLLPLKIVLFMFSGAAFAILPYLTIHMKDIGISDIDVALIYTVLPFLVFIGPPFVGYAADKLGNNNQISRCGAVLWCCTGNYTRVVMLMMVCTGVFHSALLLVPHTVVTATQPNMTARLQGGAASLHWTACTPELGNTSCALQEVGPGRVSLTLTNCKVI